MTARLFGVCVTLALSIFMATGGALLAQPRGVPPCPPRERGYDPCPRGMVGEAPNWLLPAGHSAGRAADVALRAMRSSQIIALDLARTHKKDPVSERADWNWSDQLPLSPGSDRTGLQSAHGQTLEGIYLTQAAQPITTPCASN